MPDLLSTPGGDVLLGVVNRYVVSGVTPQTQPAAIDTSLSAGRSWLATWTGDPPDPPLLPPDQSLLTIDAIQPGNRMIRGFGTAPVVVEVPVLGERGLLALALCLALAGWLFLVKPTG